MVPYIYADWATDHSLMVPEAEVYHMRNGESMDVYTRHGKLLLKGASTL